MQADNELALRNARKAVMDDLVSVYAATKAEMNRVAWRIDDAVLGATQTALNTSFQIMATLTDEGSATTKLLSGEWTWTKWLDRAGIAKNNLLSARKNLRMSVPTWGRFWNEVLVTSATQTRELISDTLDSAVSLTPWIAGAAIVLGIAYIVTIVRP